MEVQERSRKLLKIVQSGMYEREDQVKLAFLSMVAGEGLFLLGPPGTAKSLTARRLEFALVHSGGGGGDNVWELEYLTRRLKFAFSRSGGEGSETVRELGYLMGQFSTPEEIFGPISVRSLKEDCCESKTEGYLPTAHVVFLDDIWKADPAIQNSLLTVVNEKCYRNGSREQKIAMQALIAASNELPAAGMGLEALWDCFLLRLDTSNIASEEQFLHMLNSTDDAYGNPFAALDAEDQKLRLKLDELEQWREGASCVDFGEEVSALLLKLKARLQLYNEALENGVKEAEQNQEQEAAKSQGKTTPPESKAKPFYVSDRRWKRIVGLLKTSAFLHGRKQVDRLDFGLVMHCIWEDKTQIAVAEQVVAEILEAYGFRSEAAEGQIHNLEQELKQHLSETATDPKFLAEEKQKLAGRIDELRQSLAQQEAEQGEVNLFASPAMLKPLQRNFVEMGVHLDVFEKKLENGKLLKE